ncbi:MAG TPA: hypothetical protein VF796_07650 [Humisphaera sp.]
MSQVYNPESSVMEQIERLALEARDVRRRVDYARSPQDRRVLNRLLLDLETQVKTLQDRLAH